jgi:hypothetical protein
MAVSHSVSLLGRWLRCMQCPCFHNVSKTRVDSGELAWTDVDNEEDGKVKGIEELGRKVEQHHQLEKRPFLQFDSRRLHSLSTSHDSRSV